MRELQCGLYCSFIFSEVAVREAIEQIKKSCPHLECPLTLKQTDEHGANIQKLSQTLLFFKKNLRESIKINVKVVLELLISIKSFIDNRPFAILHLKILMWSTDRGYFLYFL